MSKLQTIYYQIVTESVHPQDVGHVWYSKDHGYTTNQHIQKVQELTILIPDGTDLTTFEGYLCLSYPDTNEKKLIADAISDGEVSVKDTKLCNQTAKNCFCRNQRSFYVGKTPEVG